MVCAWPFALISAMTRSRIEFFPGGRFGAPQVHAKLIGAQQNKDHATPAQRRTRIPIPSIYEITRSLRRSLRLIKSRKCKDSKRKPLQLPKNGIFAN